MAGLNSKKVELRLIYSLPLTDWNSVGIELGISQNTLATIRMNNVGDVIAQKREMFTQWLRQDINASYQKLIEAVLKQEPADKESLVKLAKNLGCTIDALIPPGQPNDFQQPVSKSVLLPEPQQPADPPMKTVEDGKGHLLDPEDVDSLFAIMKNAKSKWRDIGRELGFTLKEMDNIMQKKGISADQDYFQELLDLWLNWAPPERPFPCTEDLLDALRHIGQHRLALNLQKEEKVMGLKKLVMRGLQLGPSLTSGYALENGSVPDSFPRKDTDTPASSNLSKPPRNGPVPITIDPDSSSATDPGKESVVIKIGPDSIPENNKAPSKLPTPPETGPAAVTNRPDSPGKESSAINDSIPANNIDVPAPSKLPMPPETGSVAITIGPDSSQAKHAGIPASSNLPTPPRNDPVPITTDPDLSPATDTVDSSGPEVEADNAEEDVVNSTGNVINSVENVSPTPYLKITDVKSDCWKVSAGGGAADGAYKMDKRPHGVAMIVSNTVFEDGTNLTNRDGGEKDEPALQTLFETLGYKVLLLMNLSGAQIKKALQIVTGHENMSFAKLRNPKDKKNLEKLNAEDCLVSGDHDSFVLCLMTHGEEGVVLGTDNEEFKINEIYNIAGKCEKLTNKPKMVFIQACRGDDIPQADGDSVTKKPRDFFFSFATFHGHAAFRGKDGTWYVKALCEIFENGHKTKDLLSMITEVHCEVNNKRYEDQDGTVLSQTPQKSDTLRYKVYFDMKEPCVLSTS